MNFREEFRFYTTVLTMVAVLLVGISPACAFISGKGLIEICAPDGSVQSVEVDSALDPFAEPEPDPIQHLDMMEKCPFCFQAAHQVTGAVESSNIFFASLPRYIAVGAGSFIPQGSELASFQPRGPPVFS